MNSQDNTNQPTVHLLKWFLTTFTLLWVLCLAMTLARGKFLLHQSDSSLSLWIDNGNDAHNDLKGFNTKTLRFTNNETGEPAVVYPAIMMTVYAALTYWTHNRILTYNIVVALISFIVAWCYGTFAFALTKTWLIYVVCFATLIFYYPLWFVFERSNMEPMVWLPTSLAALAILLRKYKSAAFLVALAASLKIYPAILFLMFLREKKYRELGLGIFFYLSLSLLGLLFLNVDLVSAWLEVRSGISAMTATQVTMFSSPAIGFDHSYFSVIKQVIRLAQPNIARTSPKHITEQLIVAAKFYTPIAALLFFATFIIRIRRLRMENQLIILTICSVTLPPLSYEYTLLNVYPVFIILVAYVCRSSIQRGSIPAHWRNLLLGSFIIVSLPLTFVSGKSAGFGSQVKLVSLLAPLVFCLVHAIDLGLDPDVRSRDEVRS